MAIGLFLVLRWRRRGDGFAEHEDFDGAARVFRIGAVDGDEAAFVGVLGDGAGVVAFESAGGIGDEDLERDLGAGLDGMEHGLARWKHGGLAIPDDADADGVEIDDAQGAGGPAFRAVRDDEAGGLGPCPLFRGAEEIDEEVSGFRALEAVPRGGVRRGTGATEVECALAAGNGDGGADAAEVKADGIGGFLAEAGHDLARRLAVQWRIDFITHAVPDLLHEGRAITHGKKADVALRRFFRLRGGGEEREQADGGGEENGWEGHAAVREE